MVNSSTQIPEDTQRFWKRYEKGKDYLYKKGLITDTQRNWNFFSGKQWEGLQSGDEELPMLNFIKPTIKHKVSTVSQNNMVAKFSDMDGREELNEYYETLNAKFSECWEKTNMDLLLWSTIKDSAVTGDGILYYGTGDVADVQQVPNTNIYYGDESEPDVQKQPYIILWQRLSLRTVRTEAELNGLSAEEIEMIVPDDETEDVIGNRDEVEQSTSKNDKKVTCIIHMEKKNGIIHVAKATKHVVYEPEHPVQVTLPNIEDPENPLKGRGLSLYPIVKISWEDFPNDARGLSEVKQLIPNQLEINKTLARRSIIIKLTAFPKIAYDGTVIQNPEDLDKVGAPIEITSGGVESVSQAIQYLSPAQSNSDPKNYADDLLENTQELSGAGETVMGNINLNRVASTAILAVRDQANLPLNEQVAKMKKLVEDQAKVWLEILFVYHPDGFDTVKEIQDPLTGEKSLVPAKITKDILDQLKPSIRIDVSNDNPWTKEAEQTWADNALAQQHITFEEYVELAPESGIVPKAKLEVILARRRANMEVQAEQQQMAYNQEMQNIAEADARGELDETPSES